MAYPYTYAYTQTFNPQFYEFAKPAAYLLYDSESQIDYSIHILRNAFMPYAQTLCFRLTPEWTQRGVIHYHGTIHSQEPLHFNSKLFIMLRTRVGRITIKTLKTQKQLKDWDDYCYKTTSTSYLSLIKEYQESVTLDGSQELQEYINDREEELLN